MTSSSQIDIPEIECSDQTAGKGAEILPRGACKQIRKVNVVVVCSSHLSLR